MALSRPLPPSLALLVGAWQIRIAHLLLRGKVASRRTRLLQVRGLGRMFAPGYQVSPLHGGLIDTGSGLTDPWQHE